MWNALRRGPASVAARSTCSSLNSASYLRSKQLRQLPKPLTRNSITYTSRPLITSPLWDLNTRQYQQEKARKRSSTATAVALEDEAIEAETEQEAHTEQASSGSQINRAARHGPVTKFKELAERNMVCQTVVDTITRDMGLETMTQVQSLTINESLKGIDVLAQARTGTGKTLAFLIPVLQNIINVDPMLQRRGGIGKRGASDDIRAIIISPTRELAEQIAVEAKKVTRNTGVIVQTAVGGSAKSFGLRKIKNEGCHILVGTPGRLKDILSDPYSNVRAPNVSAFVLDEADRLLDQGFAPEIEEIQRLLPSIKDVDRQTLLYSATVPREVMQIVRRTMKPDFKFVRTVQEGEQQTHEKVPQKLVTVSGFENTLPALVELSKRELDAGQSNGKPFKAIVYFSSTAETSLAASMLNNLRSPGASMFQQHPLHPAKIVEIHAKLTQMERTRAADAFRRADSAIMLSSDVTARGMDFPNVTHVIQIGIPPSEEQYVHRIGRTARGDKTGEGWLFITGLEHPMTRSKLRGMPLKPDTSIETATVDMKKDAQLPEEVANTLTQVGAAMRMVPMAQKGAAYMAYLGLYNWMNDKQALVDAMNNRSKYGFALDTPPSVGQGLVNKLGLGRVRGLNIQDRRGDYGSENAGGGGRPAYGFRDSDRRGSEGGYGSRGGGYGGRSGSGGYGGGSGGRGGGYSDRSRGGGYGDRSGGRGGGYGDRSGGGSYGDRSGGGGYGDRSGGRGGGYGDRSGGGGYGGRSEGGRRGAYRGGDSNPRSVFDL